MNNYESIIDGVLDKEKGYVNLPNDKGGPTNFGITLAVARKYGYQGDMRDLPLTLAREIYRIRYIAGPKFDQIADLDAAIGRELIDTGINMGPGVAATMFQRWLNGLNKQGTFYADVFVDGNIGTVTINAFKAYLKARGSAGRKVMLYALNCTQGTRYLELAEANQTQEDFLFGWMAQRVVNDLEAQNGQGQSTP